MDRMFSAQSERMTTLEQRLIDKARRSREAYEGIAQRLDHETSARQEQMSFVNNNLKNITERLNRLETVDPETKTPQDKQSGATQVGWVPQHVILGGWPDNSSKQTIEADTATFLQLPVAVRELCLRPYAPNKFGEIAKMKVLPKKVAEVQWEIA